MNERGVSVAVSHLLTITITTVLLAGLVTAGGNVIDQQHHQATEAELLTVGDRVVTDLVAITTTGQQSNASVTLTPEYAAGPHGRYELSLRAVDCVPGPDYDGCLEVTDPARDISVTVPVSVPGATIENGSATADQAQLVYTNTTREVTITE